MSDTNTPTLLLLALIAYNTSPASSLRRSIAGGASIAMVLIIAIETVQIIARITQGLTQGGAP